MATVDSSDEPAETRWQALAPNLQKLLISAGSLSVIGMFWMRIIENNFAAFGIRGTFAAGMAFALVATYILAMYQSRHRLNREAI